MARFDGKRLRDLRRERGLTQVALAKRVRVARNTINRLEIGDREPSIALRQRLAKALTVDVVALVGGRMETYRYQYEKLNNAVGAMMSPTLPLSERIAGSMSEASIALREITGPPELVEAYQALRRALPGEGELAVRAARLTEAQLAQFTDALQTLYIRVLRAYHWAEAR
jgi:putative transcriptional regulator